MIWTPHITVAAVLKRDSQFLFVQEKIAGNLVINQPAGHLEDGETLLEASRREVLEETGWYYQPTALIGIYHWKSPLDRKTFIRFCFTGDLTEHDAGHKLDSVIEQIMWLTEGELHERRHELRSPLVVKCMEDYLAGSRIDLSVLNHI